MTTTRHPYYRHSDSDDCPTCTAMTRAVISTASSLSQFQRDEIFAGIFRPLAPAGIDQSAFDSEMIRAVEHDETGE